jgi:putative sugar O-methyltransferase
LVRYRGRHLSQDLANSALEYAAIAEHVDLSAATVIELGGGYGRLAWLLLEAHPDVRIVSVDIPPALAIAQEYLTRLHPSLPAFRFRHFENWEDVAAELSAARFVFLTPNQLDMAPPLGARLFMNVSSLHEMTRGQIEHYFAVAGRHAGAFYTKQWRHWRNPVDGIEVGHDDYPVPASWHVVFDRVAPVQRDFFEALYEIR